MTSQKRSVRLSFLLRHRPDSAKLSLDKEGWCSIQELVENTDFTVRELVEIVQSDTKTRYALSPSLGECLQTGEPPALIRANQGHSTGAVKMTFKTAVPPTVLYHGIQSTSWPAISKQGLNPMRRHHVHLSDDIETAESVAGRRRGAAAVLRIDAKQMLTDGVKFFISENGVWLVDHVDPKYIYLDYT
jgi:putative RNA 2'-phosphotransferase